MSGKRILLVQLFSNGDCLLATTIARQIKNDFPECHLTWAIAEFCQDIIHHNPYIDKALLVPEVKKNDIMEFRRLKKKFLKQKMQGFWDEVFITHNMDDNQALYDGTVRGMLFRAYPGEINVPLEPVLILTEEEKNNVQDFVDKHSLNSFKNVILWEYAPQSGQSMLTYETVVEMAEEVSALPATCVIMTAAKPFPVTQNVFDASTLTIRENAALTHHCHLLIGCSSGITWVNTSSAAKKLPMLQLLDPEAYFFNPPSVDFERNNISTEQLIELVKFNKRTVITCIRSIIAESFLLARKKYNQDIPLRFNTTRKIVYNLLCYLQFNAVKKHYKIMTGLYGRNPELIKQFRLGILTFPFKLIGNTWRKRIARL